MYLEARLFLLIPPNSAIQDKVQELPFLQVEPLVEKEHQRTQVPATLQVLVGPLGETIFFQLYQHPIPIPIRLRRHLSSVAQPRRKQLLMSLLSMLLVPQLLKALQVM